MTTSTKHRTRVEPSARDPIAAWLDVFVGLLNLPKDQKQTIRDELEDHLRSRVDDLLITGITESEATRQAVAELGETAELARSFRAASRTSHTRRLIMTASLCTILGAGAVLGITAVTGTALSANHTANTAVVSTESGDTLAVRGKTFGELFADIAARADRPLLVHWDRLGNAGIEPDEPIGMDVDPLPAHRLHQLLSERAAYHHGESLAVIESDDIVEITTRTHQDARTSSLRTYDVRDLVELHSGMDAGDLVLQGESGQWRSAAEGLFETIVMLSEPDAWAIMGGDAARGRLAGASLLIEAPERLHERVVEVLAIMRDDAERTEVAARQDSEQAAHEQRQAVSKLGHELETVTVKLAHLEARCDQLETQIASEKPTADASGAIEGLSMELSKARLERDLAKLKARSLTSLVAELEIEQVMEGTGR